MELQLHPGQTYSLKVTEFKPRNKQITKKKDGQQYDLYFVKVEDKQGNGVMCEYVAPAGTDQANTFTKGSFQFIRCGYLSAANTPEIEPANDPSQGLQQRMVPAQAAIDKTNGEAPVDMQHNAYAIPLGGKAVTYSMSIAKDLLVAEIGQQPFGYKVTNEDIDRMFAWADAINNDIAERLNF